MVKVKDRISSMLLAVIGCVAVLAMVVASGCISPGENSSSATDTSSGADVGQGSGSSNPPIAKATTAVIETEPDNQELKLLKKIGPIELPPYGEKTDGTIWDDKEGYGTLTTQIEKFVIDDVEYVVGINSFRNPSIMLRDLSQKDLVILIVLRDESGTPISLSKVDEETGNPYFLKGVVNACPGGCYCVGSTVPIEIDKVKISAQESSRMKEVKTWEVLVYG